MQVPARDASPAGSPAAGEPGLTIGELARRTGLNTATLRMWEARYGFPRAQRLPSGHRRFAVRTVDDIAQVLRRRDAGVRLESAVAAVAGSDPSLPSVFADLRHRHPQLQPRTLRKSTVLALSWAVEDECCARAQQPWLFGTFQEERYYRQAQDRWRDLARTARGAWVLADFPASSTLATTPATPPVATPASAGPVEVPLRADSAMTREWSVVCLASDFPAALAAWELPGQQGVPQGDRLFESVWTLEPQPVANAARCCARVVEQQGHDTTAVLEDADRLAGTGPGDLRHATSVFSRALGYLEGAG
ncbi:MAG: MerR family transcriptional regulator, light-induced transcriptional regulator [Nocardioidaceae bacterium]|jgi:DICT domain-containing protein|nr:MerR family transcriptional regulator, light-induced transcriptional regulator [Nocardioidaceae bacterium]